MNETKEGASPVHILEVTPTGEGGAWNSGEVQQQWLPTCLSLLCYQKQQSVIQVQLPGI